MDLVLAIALSVAAGCYILAPLYLWIRGSRFPAIKWETLAPQTALAPGAEAHFSNATAFLTANGFSRAGERVCETTENGLANVAQLWRNRETGETAFVATILKADDDAYCSRFAVFLHERGKGALIVTSNFSTRTRVLLDPPGTSKINAAEDLAALRRLHQGHVAVVGGESRPIRMRDALTLCQALDASTRATALARKRYRSNGDSLRITFWGAFYGVWINLPPFRTLYDRRDRRLLEQARATGDASPARAQRAA